MCDKDQNSRTQKKRKLKTYKQKIVLDKSFPLLINYTLYIQDTDCLFGYDRDSVVCKDNLCECSEDFYERSENICRRKSMSKYTISQIQFKTAADKITEIY